MALFPKPLFQDLPNDNEPSPNKTCSKEFSKEFRPRLFSRDGYTKVTMTQEDLEREAMEEAIAEPRIGSDGKDRSLSKERMANGSGRRDVVGSRKHLKIYYET